MLIVYGTANIIGNIISGKLLIKNANKFVASFPFTLGVIYVSFFAMGKFALPMFFIVLAWGILSGAGGVINQFWITSAAPEAPEFANGLFLASTNLGTTIATSVCGLFISGMGVQYVVFGGLLFLSLSIIMILLRVNMYRTAKSY